MLKDALGGLLRLRQHDTDALRAFQQLVALDCRQSTPRSSRHKPKRGMLLISVESVAARHRPFSLGLEGPPTNSECVSHGRADFNLALVYSRLCVDSTNSANSEPIRPSIWTDSDASMLPAAGSS